jgi:hypothetical protein
MRRDGSILLAPVGAPLNGTLPQYSLRRDAISPNPHHAQRLAGVVRIRIAAIDSHLRPRRLDRHFSRCPAELDNMRHLLIDLYRLCRLPKGTIEMPLPNALSNTGRPPMTRIVRHAYRYKRSPLSALVITVLVVAGCTTSS